MSTHNKTLIGTYFYNYYAMNCLNTKCVTIYRTKCVEIVTLKDLPTICFCYNSEEKGTKFPNPKKKLNKTDE